MIKRLAENVRLYVPERQILRLSRIHEQIVERALDQPVSRHSIHLLVYSRAQWGKLTPQLRLEALVVGCQSSILELQIG